MKMIRIAATVLIQTPLDWAGNRARVISAIDEARRQGANLLCLSELCIIGYGCEDMFHSATVSDSALNVLEEIVPHTHALRRARRH